MTKITNSAVNNSVDATFLGKPMALANSHARSLDDRFVVEGLLNKSEVALFCGAPNIGKTAILAGLAASVSKGEQFGSRETCQSTIVYIGAEDARGILDRAFPHLRNAGPDCAPFFVHDRAVDLTCTDTTLQIIADAKRLMAASPTEGFLIVLDTLNPCLGEGDENSTRDMSRVIANAQRIAKDTGGASSSSTTPVARQAIGHAVRLR